MTERKSARGGGGGRTSAGPARGPAGLRTRARAGARARRLGWAAALLVTACCGAAGPAFAAGGTPSPDPSPVSARDVRLVYCLGKAHREPLVLAAERLGLLRPGDANGSGAPDLVRTPGEEVLDLDTWAVRYEPEFTRACTALMAADSPDPDSPDPAQADKGQGDQGQGDQGQDGSWVDELLRQAPLLFVGALLTLLGQGWERAAAERRQRRQEFDAASAAFRVTAHAYLAAYRHSPGTDHGPVAASRDALVHVLSRTGGSRARRAEARRAADALPLARPLPRARNGRTLGEAERQEEIARVRAELARGPAEPARGRGRRPLRPRHPAGAPSDPAADPAASTDPPPTTDGPRPAPGDRGDGA
ncbi:hypothetical protein ACN20G_30300 (plasmid) [Streptomyces sp. BI20]|uniref:hypothetical protein n=1 Tax=Streptomyces sp. BI20 TaxID=3403460 RepID=UPI003C721386